MNNEKCYNGLIEDEYKQMEESEKDKLYYVENIGSKKKKNVE